jgi:pyoverdine/dityrosine biosynthesis protein Dit1
MKTFYRSSFMSQQNVEMKKIAGWNMHSYEISKRAKKMLKKSKSQNNLIQTQYKKLSIHNFIFSTLFEAQLKTPISLAKIIGSKIHFFEYLKMRKSSRFCS